MKVDYVSDLHIDFWIKEKNPESHELEKEINNFCEILNITGGEVIIIAGDLGHYFTQDTAFLLRLKGMYDHVMVVPGNHDMYLVSKTIQKKYNYKSINRIIEMKDFCAQNDIIYFDGQVQDINGFKFGGLGMSWDCSYYEKLTGMDGVQSGVRELFNLTMTDSKLIFDGENYTVPSLYGARSITSFDPFEFFNGEKAKLDRIESDIDVMITHYSPIVQPKLLEKYINEKSSTFYYFDGSEAIQRIKPKNWIFGHTHTRYDFIKDGTRFLCNPLGHPGEMTYAIIRSFKL